MPPKKIILRRKEGLYLKDAGTKGRGVFCTHAIRKGEELEVTPSLLLNEEATGHLDETILVDYAFKTGPVSKRQRRQAGIKKIAACCNVIMGIASFCNHSENPNAEIVWEEVDGTIYHTLQATRAIPKNAEICTVYGEGWFEDRK